MKFSTATAAFAILASFATATVGQTVTREEHQRRGAERDLKREGQKQKAQDREMLKYPNVLAQAMVERPVGTWNQSMTQAFCKVTDLEKFAKLMEDTLNRERGGAGIDLKRASRNDFYNERDLQRNTSYTYEDIVRQLNTGKITHADAIVKADKALNQKKNDLHGAILGLDCKS